MQKRQVVAGKYVLGKRASLSYACLRLDHCELGRRLNALPSSAWFSPLDAGGSAWSGPDFEVLSVAELERRDFKTRDCFEQAALWWREQTARVDSATSVPLYWVGEQCAANSAFVAEQDSAGEAGADLQFLSDPPCAFPLALGAFSYAHEEGGFLSLPGQAFVRGDGQVWFYCAWRGENAFPGDECGGSVNAKEFARALLEWMLSRVEAFLEAAEAKSCSRGLESFSSAFPQPNPQDSRRAVEGCAHDSRPSPQELSPDCSVGSSFPGNGSESPAPVAVDRSFPLTESEWAELVQRAREEIKTGKLEKVVLARSVVERISPPVALDRLVAELKSRFASCSVFCIGDLVGASPEMLASLRRGSFLSRVLAGSVPAGQETQTLWEDAKQLSEHALAARSVVESLAARGLEARCSGPFLLELPNISHLASDVTIPAPGENDALSLAGAIHPSAAVCGYPRAQAAALIEKLEGRSRGYYAGAVGWLDARGEGEWALALRCARFSRSQPGVFELWAGAGIMGDSVPELEVVETRVKLAAMGEALAAACAQD